MRDSHTDSRTDRPRARHTPLPPVLACVLALAWAAAPAGAVVAEFGNKGQGAGEMEEPRGLAVDQESGDVYVVDTRNYRVEKFSGEGQFLLGWGWGVSDGAPALETCTTTCGNGLRGTGAGQLEFPHGIAVDESGLSHDVYVMDTGNARVQKFTSNGEFVLMFGKHVNATTSGDVCLAGESCQAGEFGTEAGAFSPAVTAQYIAVGATGTVYVGDLGRVQKFDPNGVQIGEVTLAGAGQVTALALDGAGDLYLQASELAGVREYEDCAGVCAGVEVGGPRDVEGLPAGVAATIAAGPSEELFVDDLSGVHHILEYGAGGEQLASFDAGGADAFGGLAFGNAIERLYALSPSKNIVRLVSLPPAGPLLLPESSGASEVGPTAATLDAKVNPEGAAGVTYRFEYGPTMAYGASTSAVALAGEGFEDETASASLGELEPATLYHFRVVVKSGAGETVGPDETFSTLAAAPVDSETVSQLTATSARLTTEIDPLGRQTEYRFEYGTSSAYGSSAPQPDASAGAGNGDVAGSILIEGLQPGTTYHFRVVAHNALGTTDGLDRTFVTQAATPAVQLADGRAWEMVSPVDKHGASLEAIAREGSVIQASEDGSAITYFAKGPVTTNPAGSRSLASSQLLSRRGPEGWSTKDISTPHESVAGLIAGNLEEYKMFTPTLSAGLVEPAGATPLSSEQAPDAERTAYIRGEDGSFTPLVTTKNVPPGVKFGGIEVVEGGLIEGGAVALDATPDLSHVIVDSPQDLDLSHSFAGGSKESLYEWVGGVLHLVSILPSGVPAAEEGLSSNLGYNDELLWNALSSDGARVFFETNQGGEHHLYVRDTVLDETAQLDLPQQGVAPGTGAPTFQGASSDGRRVYFTDQQRLTANARAPGAYPDLYTCEVDQIAGRLACGGLKDLSVPVDRLEHGDMLGNIVGIDARGDSVYFVANGRLTSAAAAGDCEGGVYGAPVLPPVDQKCALYRYSTQGGAVTFIGMLSNRDAAEWEGEGQTDLGITTARESADGRFFAFMSQAPLTGFDNTDARSGVRDEEVFLYDSERDSLTCVSCAASGARPTGQFDPNEFPGLLVDRSIIWQKQTLAGSIPGWTKVDVKHAMYPSRVLSDNGRLFFNSPDDLVPQDTNGKEDVYEYEPQGVGTCGDPSGCVSLMSGGSGEEESAFLDASSEGEDVFFLTASKLVPADIDTALDVYDAHACRAASPCPSSAATVSGPPACSASDSCRSSAPAAPPVVLAASAGFYGTSGNLSPKPAVRTRRVAQAQKLTDALKRCKKIRSRKRRALCERRARSLHAAKSKRKRSAK
jgi:hypothetical protein